MLPQAAQANIFSFSFTYVRIKPISGAKVMRIPQKACFFNGLLYKIRCKGAFFKFSFENGVVERQKKRTIRITRTDL
jgi:hypothetical protein